MGRVDEEHVTFTGLGGGQDGSVGPRKRLGRNVLGQVFVGGRGRTDR